MRMSEIMSAPVASIDAAASGDTAWNAMRLSHTHHLVVVQGREVIGVISSRDLEGKRDRLVAELMSRDVVTADPRTTVRQAANQLRGRHIGCLPIVEGGKLVGKQRGQRKRPHVTDRRSGR